MHDLDTPRTGSAACRATCLNAGKVSISRRIWGSQNRGVRIDFLEVLYVRLKADLIWLLLEKRRAYGPNSGLALDPYFLNPRP